MGLYYSKSTGGFYDDIVNDTLPTDAVTITAERHQELLEAQSSGQMIWADADGIPQAVDRPERAIPSPPEPTNEELLAQINNILAILSAR